MTEFKINFPTVQECQDYMETVGVGINDAKRILTRGAIILACQKANTVAELQQVVEAIITKLV